MSQSDVAILRDAYQAFSKGDVPAVVEAFDPDIEWVESGKGVPWTGTHRGVDTVVNNVFGPFVEYWGGPGVAAVETEQFLDAGEHVVVTGRFQGRDASGQQLDAPFAHVWRVRDGKAVRFQNYTDWTV
jgi:ketosteroid isomerase-like protein